MSGLISQLDGYVVPYVSSDIWTVIKAVLLFIVAFLIAKLVKFLITKLMTKTGIYKLLGKSRSDDAKMRIVNFVSRLISLLVFLLFVPGIFETLGMTEVSSPIITLLETVWGYVPNIIATVVILWVGIFIAGTVRDLLIPVFNKIRLNKLQEKAGMEVPDSAKLSNTLAYIVYIIILVPVIIVALKALRIDVISEPAVAMLETVFSYVPNIIAALVIIVIGYIIAKFAGNLVERLIAATGLDAKISKLLDGKAKDVAFSRIIGIAVHVVIVIFFVVEGLNILHLSIVSTIGAAIISYLPYLLASALILLACFVCSTIVERILRKHGNIFGAIAAKTIIYVIGVFMVLNELGVATAIVNSAFVIAVAALGVAFAVSFGVGGREFAGRTLKKLEEKFDKKETEPEEPKE